MPTHYEAALMSHLAYQYTEARARLNSKNYLVNQSVFFTGGFDCNINDLRVLFCNPFGRPRFDHQVALYLHERGWQVFYNSDYFLDRYDPRLSLTELTGYFGLAFINRRDTAREIVVAHRGTILSSNQNILDDIEILKAAGGSKPFILSNALTFIAQIIRLRRDTDRGRLRDYAMTQTGHSLGGFLAEFGAAYVANPEHLPESVLGECHYYKLHVPRPSCAAAITFDSLGSSTLLARYGIPSNGHRTINYLLKPNVANTANVHDGERRQLFRTPTELEFSVTHAATFSVSATEIINIRTIFETVESHLLTNLLGYFNPSTGEPILYRTVYDWPVAINTFTYSTQPPLSAPSFSSGEGILEGFFKIALALAPLYFHQRTDGVVQMEHRHEGRITYQPEDAIDLTAPGSSSSSSTTDVLGSTTRTHTSSASSSSSATGPTIAPPPAISQQLAQQGIFTSTSQQTDETATRRTGYRPRGSST